MGRLLIWSEPVLDIDTSSLRPEVEVKPSPPYAGKAGPLDIAGLGLPAGSAVANAARRTLSVNGATLSLAGSTAATFNELFAKPQGKQGVFSAGEELGRISLVAESQ